ncbi:MAG: hypothetical protein WAT14_14925, partial [Chitinophagaceae bacterium]
MKRNIFITLLCLFTTAAYSNNIQITNVSVQSATNTIQFTVSWDNSWRSSTLNNWDAAWVFLKYYNPLALEWQSLYFTNTGNVIPSGYSADMGATSGLNVGAFLYRSSPGSGTSTITDIQLGIPSQQAIGIYDIKVFAVEMVYIPQGSFFAGDAASGSGRYAGNSSLTTPGYVNTMANAPSVYDPLAGAGIFLNSLTSGFPNGYNAFYCMKYELSQGGYRDFLNCLTYTQQAIHIRNTTTPAAVTGTPALVSTAGTNRSYIEIKTPGSAVTSAPAVFGCDADGDNVFDEATDGEWVACNYINWPGQAAYLAWSGLRPITELEYEKTCRGIQLPVASEYAWGTSFIITAPYTLSNAGQSSEVPTTFSPPPFGNSNYINSTTGGPMRNGIFATATSNRVS